MVKEYCNYLLNRTIRSLYVVNQGDYKFVENLLLAYTRRRMSEKQILEKFTEFIKGHKKLERDGDINYKVDYITESIDITPTKVLDIGAGNASILTKVKQHYQLDKNSVYALDLKPISNDEVTVIHYTDDMKLPFADEEVDLIIMLSLLHHVPSNARNALLSEVNRVLSKDGRVVIREHDGSNAERSYYIFLQLLHYVWYIYQNEDKDELHLMKRSETIQLFERHGMVPHSYIKPVGNSNVQRLYGEVYKKVNHDA